MKELNFLFWAIICKEKGSTEQGSNLHLLQSGQAP